MSTLQTETYERLVTAEKERSGNVETATVETVDVTDDAVVLTLGFPWSTDTERLVYDLNDERDVCRLAAVAHGLGYQFDQVPALEGEPLPVRYTERGWLPEPDVDGSEQSGSRPGAVEPETDAGWSVPNPLAPVADRIRSASTDQLIIGVILFKKLVIVALIAYLVL